MSTKADRLNRLARAQGKLVRALEMEMHRAEQKSRALTAAGQELDDMAVRVAAEQPSLIPALLRRLAETESRAEHARCAVESLQQRLLTAKFREEAMSGRARLLKDAQARKAGEEDALETVLQMKAKASGKRDVLI